MLDGLKSLVAGGVLLHEIQGLRTALTTLIGATERIASALELRNAQDYPPPAVANPDGPPLEVAYVDGAQQAAFMDIELRLTQARGAPPTEDEILLEFQRRYPEPAGEAL